MKQYGQNVEDPKMRYMFVLFGLVCAVIPAANAQQDRKENYACAIQRWHYSGKAGFEILALVDTTGNGSPMNSGYLYSRTTRDLDDYFVQSYFQMLWMRG